MKKVLRVYYRRSWNDPILPLWYLFEHLWVDRCVVRDSSLFYLSNFKVWNRNQYIYSGFRLLPLVGRIWHDSAKIQFISHIRTLLYTPWKYCAQPKGSYVNSGAGVIEVFIDASQCSFCFGMTQLGNVYNKLSIVVNNSFFGTNSSGTLLIVTLNDCLSVCNTVAYISKTPYYVVVLIVLLYFINGLIYRLDKTVHKCVVSLQYNTLFSTNGVCFGVL